MHLVLIGAPASGKGTQASRLTRYFAIDHISTGEMLRAEVARRSELGLVVESYLKHGRLVPDNLVMRLVRERLVYNNLTNGFIMDGFPRTLSQAHALDEVLRDSGHALDAVVLIDVSDCAVLERITGRRADPETGRIYHLKFSPPPSEILHRLEQRDDDTEGVMRTRLATYHERIDPVITHYQDQGLLIRVDGSPPPDQVFQDIIRRLTSLAAKG